MDVLDCIILLIILPIRIFVGIIIKMKPTHLISEIIFFVCALLISSCQPISENISNTPSPTYLDHQASPDQINDEEAQEENDNDLLSDKIPHGLKLEFWHPWAGETAEIVEELVDNFNQENDWSITIKSISHADEDVFVEDLTDAFKNEEQIPDLIVSTSQSLHAWYAEGYPIKELDSFIRSDSEVSAGATLPEIFPAFWNIDVLDEKRLGVPAYQSGQFLFYNQTWGNELGFDDFPGTIEAFSERACAAARSNLYDTITENNGTGGWIYSSESLSLLSWLRVFGGGDLINSRAQPIFTQPENVSALTFLYDLYLDDCAWTGRDSEPYSYFSNRMAIFYSGQMEDIIKQINFDTDSENSDAWILVPYPSAFGKPILMVKGLSYAITTEHEERSIAAWEFIKWMLAPENQALFVEKTGTFPLSAEVIERMDVEAEIYPIWKDSLQYLPYTQAEPSYQAWYVIEKVLEDVGWQLTQYTMRSEDIQTILSDAEIMIREFE